MAHLPKAALYYSPQSIWASIREYRRPCCARRTIDNPPVSTPHAVSDRIGTTAISPHVALPACSEEKGYGGDEVDLKKVDLGEHVISTRNPLDIDDVRVHQQRGRTLPPHTYASTPVVRLSNSVFHRLSSITSALLPGTVPTLVVPLEKTLAPEIESRYKAIQDTKVPVKRLCIRYVNSYTGQSIVEFLDKSRSVQSRTHTTSTAPSPSLAPATIAFSTVSNLVIDVLHSQAADPNALFYMNARSEEELRTLAKNLLPFLTGRRDALAKLLADSDAGLVQVSDKTKAFWQVKKLAADKFLQVFGDAEKSEADLSEEARLSRTEYLKSATAAWTGLQDVLTTLNKEIIGPYVLGRLAIATFLNALS